MQINTALTINDGSATPVAKSFTPERISPELSTFVERSADVSAGFLRLTVGLSPATSKRPTNRVDVAFDLPIMATVDGISKVSDVARFKGYFVIPETAPATLRANLHAFVANALNQAAVKAVIKDLDPMY